MNRRCRYFLDDGDYSKLLNKILNVMPCTKIHNLSVRLNIAEEQCKIIPKRSVILIFVLKRILAGVSFLNCTELHPLGFHSGDVGKWNPCMEKVLHASQTDE